MSSESERLPRRKVTNACPEKFAASPCLNSDRLQVKKRKLRDLCAKCLHEISSESLTYCPVTGGGFTETTPGSGVYTVSGLTTASADTALDNVQFTPTDNTGPSGTFNTNISVTVNDQGGGGEQAVLAATTVAITRIDDDPVITSNGGAGTAAVNVAENATAVTTVTSSDVDGGTPSYAITGGPDAARFAINPASGELTFAAAPDFEAPDEANTDNVYEFTVEASDGLGGTDSQDISVTVLDADEFDVTTPSDVDGTVDAVPENAANASTVGITVSASDADATNNAVTYSLIDDAGGRFSIDSTAGIVVVSDGTLLDREVAASHDIIVRATSADGSTADSDFTVNLVDVDEFDVTAISDTDGDLNAVAENAATGTSVGVTALASDADATTNTVTYSLDDDSSGQFTIDGSTGEVTVAGSIDFEAGATRSITVRATGEDGSFSTRIFIISIVDGNDNSPVIDPGQSLLVAENVTNGTSVGHITANDVDTVGSLQNWSITDGNGDSVFAIDPASGEITVADNTALNFEATDSYTLTVQVEDGVNTSPVETVTITVSNVNEAPVIAVPSTQVTDEDELLTFSAVNGNAISIADVDAGADAVRVSLSVSNGTLTLGSLTGLTFASGSGTSDAVMTVVGTLSDINAALNNLMYLPDANFHGGDALVIVTDDQGNSGSGGPLSDSRSIDISVTSVNDAPVHSVPGAQIIDEDKPLMFSTDNGNQIFVNDIDVDGADLQWTISASGGVLSLDRTAGLSFIRGDGSEDVLIQATGSVAAINTALDGLTFQPDQDLNGGAGISIVTSDLGSSGSGGPLTDSDGVAIFVNHVNDAPVNVTPAPQVTNEDTPLVFSAVTGNAISLSDVDAGSALVGVRLTATDGTLRLSSISGLTFALGGGTDDADLIFAATLDDANVALEGLIFRPDADFHGNASIELLVRDMGNTGQGGELTDQDTIDVVVLPVNDAPVAIADSYEVNEDEVLTMTVPLGVLASDGDIDGDTLVVSANSQPAHGTLLLNADGSFDYRPELNFNGTDSFSYLATDGTLVSNTVVVTLNVNPVNDVPVSTEDEFVVNQLDSLTVAQDEGVLSNDSDIENDALAAVLVVGPANGALTLNPDGSFLFVPNPTFFGEDSFTYFATDGEADGEPVEVFITVHQTVSSTGNDSGAPETDTGTETVDTENDAVIPDAVDDTAEPIDNHTIAETATARLDENDNLTGIDPSISGTPETTPDGAKATQNDDPVMHAELASTFRRVRDRLAAGSSSYGHRSAAPERILASEIPVMPEGSIIQVLAHAGLWEELDQFEERLITPSEETSEFDELIVGTTSVAGTSLTVGYVIWLLRSGSILVSFVSSLPAWTMMDPLPVLEDALAANANEDDHSLQDILDDFSNKSSGEGMAP